MNVIPVATQSSVMQGLALRYSASTSTVVYIARATRDSPRAPISTDEHLTVRSLKQALEVMNSAF